jgi:hypothetical protein
MVVCCGFVIVYLIVILLSSITSCGVRCSYSPDAHKKKIALIKHVWTFIVLTNFNVVLSSEYTYFAFSFLQLPRDNSAGRHFGLY